MNRNSTFVSLFILFLGALIFLAACRPATPGVSPKVDDFPGVKLLQSQTGRETAPDVPAADLQALISGNSAFALDFYHAVRQEEHNQNSNLFFSPYSLSQALAMTYAGARNKTAEQMAEVMHFDLEQAKLHPAFNTLDLGLSGRETQATQNPDQAQVFQLDIANSLWGEQTYTFLPEFIDLLARQYGAGLRLVDFLNKPEETRLLINEWVLQRTQEKIKDLLPPRSITTDAKLVLVNAIYFKADWLHPFGGDATRDWPFTLLDGSQVSVPMMSLEHPTGLPYVAGDGFQAVELPYAGENTAMLLIVPDAGSFATLESDLDAAFLEQITNGMSVKTVALSVPRFSFETTYQFKDTLSEMGMIDAFKAELADLSGMDGTLKLNVDNVYHKAFVAVDEKGTEAAAASAVVVVGESAIMNDINLTVDRPFIFAILDKPSGTILFMGRVVNPLQ